MRTLVAGPTTHYTNNSILIISAGTEGRFFPHEKAALEAAFSLESVEASYPQMSVSIFTSAGAHDLILDGIEVSA